MNKYQLHIPLIITLALCLHGLIGGSLSAQTFSLLELQSTSSRYGVGDVSDGTAVGYASLRHDPSYLFKREGLKTTIGASATLWERSDALSQHLSMYSVEGAMMIGSRQLIYLSAGALKPYRITQLSVDQKDKGEISPYEVALDLGYAVRLSHWSLFASVGGAFSDYYKKNIAYTLSSGVTYTHHYDVYGSDRRVDGLLRLSNLAVMRSGDDVKAYNNVPTALTASGKYSMSVMDGLRLGLGATVEYVMPKRFDYVTTAGGVEAVIRDSFALSLGIHHQSSGSRSLWTTGLGVRYAFSSFMSANAGVNLPLKSNDGRLSYGNIGLICYF